MCPIWDWIRGPAFSGTPCYGRDPVVYAADLHEAADLPSTADGPGAAAVVCTLVHWDSLLAANCRTEVHHMLAANLPKNHAVLPIAVSSTAVYRCAKRLGVRGAEKFSTDVAVYIYAARHQLPVSTVENGERCTRFDTVFNRPECAVFSLLSC